MTRILFPAFLLHSFLIISPMPAAAENQTWKVRPGDNLEIIATTLDITKEEIKRHNPGLLEGSLRIGQKVNLPLQSHLQAKMLEEGLNRKAAALEEELRKEKLAIGRLESQRSELEKQIAVAEAQLRWHPVWFWGFWIYLGILGAILSGACWVFRQTHPRVFEQPRGRSIRDLRESQIRVRSSLAHEEETRGSLGDPWPPPARPYRLDVRGHARQLSLRGLQRLGPRSGLVLARKPV